MISIENTLISDDLCDVCFACDLDACHGHCCVEGDAGAPLEEEEIPILEDCLEHVKPYMLPEGIAVVEQNGVFDYDAAGNFVTPLINGVACAFICYEGEMAFCAIEKAFRDKKITYQKPISCHLYPVRISDYRTFEAVNYHKWHLCKPALAKGKVHNVPLYVFLKEPLIRKYGEDWYRQLVESIEEKN